MAFTVNQEISVAQKNLHIAKQQKLDEFYTQIGDIERECSRYRKQFKGKVIFLNCDDPVELADKAGLHRTYIGSIERGEQNVSIDNIDKISKALKIEITSLFN